ncbi:hypothetical protein K5D65_21170 [Pseudomonas cichorii]|nr:hypothetical protein [Pseudomonas cichorii]
MNKYILTATVLISGCAPLQQAPLVYTSKQVLGIDISAPTTESAGISLNVGFKNIDAAYVPVAVSKEKGSEKDTFIKEIFATYGEGQNHSNSEKKLTAEQKPIVEKIKEIRSEKDEKIAQLKTLELKSENYNTLLKTLKTVPNNSPAISEISKDIEKIKQSLETVPLIKESIEQNKKVDDTALKASAEVLKENISNLTAEENNKITELKNSVDISKRDAMSVFGSFSSSVNGEKASGVSQNLGKMFSTGVAAQNLTQGIQKYSTLEKCIELINAAALPAQKDAIIKMCTD